MSESGAPRQIEKIVGDLLDAASAAADIVARGQEVWDADRILRLAAEAIINRIGDAAAKLRNQSVANSPFSRATKVGT